MYDSGSTQFGDTSGDTHKFTGLVGINESSPDEALHITSTAASATPVILLENSNANNLAPQINFYKNSASPADGDYAGQIDFEGKDSAGNRTVYGRIITEQYRVLSGAEDGIMDLQVAVDGTLTTGVRIRGGSGARVGIGTTNPQGSLHSVGSWNNNLVLQGTGGDTALRFMDSSGNTDGYVYGSASSVGFLDDDGNWAIQCTTDNYTAFYINNSEKMRITYDGRVGLGTSSPGPRLDVRGAAQTSGTNLKHHITVTDNATGWNSYPASGIAFAGNYNSTPSQIEFAGIIGKKQNATHGDLRGQMQFLTNTNSNVQTIAMTINSSQNVGIGSTNPSAKLDVAGAVKTSDKFQIGNASVMEFDGGNLSIQHDEESVNTIIRGFDGDGSLTVGEGVTEINGNLKLTKSSNSWISIRAQDGHDTTGGGITIYETGGYSVSAPQYGAKIVYNEDTDDFKMGTMNNYTYMAQLTLPRGSKRLEVTGEVRPTTDNFYDLGNTSFKWDDVRATNL